MKTPIVLFVFWDRPRVPEAVASSCASASCYRHSENVWVVAVVIFELTFRDVERQIFGADLVIAADNRPLEDRPEAFNRLSVDRADNVFVGAVHDGLMRIFAKALISNVFVGREQANFSRNGFAHETLHIDRRQRAKDASNDIAVTLDGADDGALESGLALAALALVHVFLFATNESFVHLDNSHQLAKFLVLQSSADAVADVPSRLVASETHMALHLHGADALFGTHHQVDDLKPVPQIDLRILKNGADKVREAISTALTAVRAFPLKFHRFERIDVRRATARAVDALRPAICDQVVVTSFLVREKLVETGRRKLLSLLGHLPSPTIKAA
jgi:hypothetical protein